MPMSTYDGVSDEPVNASACAAGLAASAGEVWTFTRITVMPPGPVQTALYAFWFPKVKFTDYFTLLKVDGEWKIMSKVYQAQPK